MNWRYLLAGTCCVVAVCVGGAIAVSRRASAPGAAARRGPATTVPAAAPAPPGSIAGAAWVIRGTGASDLLRGLRVTLSPAAVDRASAMQCVEATKAELAEQIAKADRKAGVYGSAAYGDVAAGYRKKAAELDREVQGLGQTVEVMDLYVLTRKASPTGRSGLDGLAASSRSRSTTTGVAGTYRLSDVPPGVYLLHARFEAAPTFVEWLIPIAINGGRESHQDLYNDNAIAIQN